MYNRIIDELQPGDFYYAFAFKEHYKGEAVPAFFRSLHRRLGEKGITDKLLGSFQVKEDIKRCFKSDKKLQMKFAKLNTPVGVAIVKNKVIQMMWGELPTAIEITSRQVYEQYKVFFEELWKEAKK